MAGSAPLIALLLASAAWQTAAPADGTLEGSWVVTTVDNIKVMTGSQVTITITGSQLTGRASCNSYSGTVAVAGDSFKASGLMVTMKACDEPRMSEERDFLDVLRQAVRYELRPNGELALLDDRGRAIVATRPPTR